MNNRELKFRAWDENGRRMMSWEELGMTFEPLSVEGQIYMQFTGLRDKNGKEIYEGDIIQMSPKWTFEAVWSKEKCCFGMRSFIEIAPKNGQRRRAVFQALRTAQTHEIIGNIYENPELLTV